MVRHAESKQILVALAVAALGFTLAACSAGKGNAPVSPTPAAPGVGAQAETQANAGVITQLLPLFYPDGTQVVSANGEPADAVLNRFANQPKQRIGWGIMTQYLTPGETYDIWLEGSNDGSDSFNW
jgi:hypothetical protein